MQDLDSVLLSNIKGALPDLRRLSESVEQDYGFEENVYRYYHQSYKAYTAQGTTNNIVCLLEEIDPKLEPEFCPFFAEIIKEGTAIMFNLHHNTKWHEARHIVEAFFHAKYFLDMAVKYGEQYEEAPRVLDYGWAALLELYMIR